MRLLMGIGLIGMLWIAHNIPRPVASGPPMWAMVAPRELESRAQQATDRTLRRWAKRKDQRRIANKLERMRVFYDEQA